MKRIKDSDLDPSLPRDKQLSKIFNIKPISDPNEKDCVKVPIDLPWDELEKDVHLAFEKFGWYGMVHRMKHNWDRSELYGGLGLTHNPSYKFDIAEHAQCFGQPRSIKMPMNSDIWLNSLESYNYTKHNGDGVIKGMNTYDDPLGFSEPNEITKFRSFKTIFDQIKMPIYHGRIAEVKAKDFGKNIGEERLKFAWHTDEPNELLCRIVIPLITNENHTLEFKDSGKKYLYERGYAYQFDSYKIHRYNFNYNANIINRTVLVIGWSPYLRFDGEYWTVNEYVNKLTPREMVLNGMVFPIKK